MKHTLLSTIAILGLGTMSANAQYAPAAGSPLANGTLNQAGYSQTITATIPASTDVSGQVLLDALPALVVQALPAGTIDPATTYPMSNVSTVLTVSGIPGGLVESCGGCTVVGGTSTDIDITGTPSVEGGFTVDIASETSGDITLPTLGAVSFGSSITLPGVPIPLDVPTISGIFDAMGYTLFIADPNGIEESNEVFSLNLFPNPTRDLAFLNVNSTVAGVANIEVFSITGALVQSSSSAIRVGANRVNIDLQSVPAGIYLVKADINGVPALIRMQKI